VAAAEDQADGQESAAAEAGASDDATTSAEGQQDEQSAAVDEQAEADAGEETAVAAAEGQADGQEAAAAEAGASDDAAASAEGQGEESTSASDTDEVAFGLVVSPEGEILSVLTSDGTQLDPASPEGMALLSTIGELSPSDDASSILRFVPNDPYYATDQYNLDAIQSPQAWDVATGQNVIVAVIDSGVLAPHNDLGGPNPGDGNIWVNASEVSGTPGVDDDNNGYVDDIAGWDFSGDDPFAFFDFHGHGTHVAGIVGAVTNNNYGVAGSAPDVLIMPIVYGNDVYGDAAAIHYAVDNGAKVINMSWGYNQSDLTPAEIQVLQDAVDYAYNNGVTLIAASGNCDRQGPNDTNPQRLDCTEALYPANLNHVISVGAVDQNEQLKYSGTKTDIVAPGVGILSTVPYQTSLGYYDYKSGSSMAAPHVAGVVALLYSHGITNPDAIRQRLVDTAK
ncbi:hypothetical protein D6779_00275, partial [Candidatus Parcubacteria bacterium]